MRQADRLNHACFRQGIFIILLLGMFHVADLGFATRVDINEDADDAFDEGFDETSSVNTSTPAPPPKEGSIADIIDRVLEKEFTEKDQQEGKLFDVSEKNNCFGNGAYAGFLAQLLMRKKSYSLFYIFIPCMYYG